MVPPSDQSVDGTSFGMPLHCAEAENHTVWPFLIVEPLKPAEMVPLLEQVAATISVEADPVLFAVFDSGEVVVTEAVFVIVPEGCSVVVSMVIVADAPAARLARVQVTVFVAAVNEQEPLVVVALT